MMTTWPVFDEDEIASVCNVLRSGKVNYWTGSECKAFEKEFASYTNTKYGIAVSNGTFALELALVALGVGPGDEVIVPSCTFIATASAVVMRGAHPVCVDIEPYSQNISAETIAPWITPKTKAIICVHLAGLPCEMDEILSLAKNHRIYVVEDCAQAHGARYKGRPVGSIGDIGAFSFCQDKIMTTGGEGGMVVTNSHGFWEKMWSFKDHGKSYDLAFTKTDKLGFRWLHESFGTNGRMTEMQAAIGRAQLKKLDAWNRKRADNAGCFVAALSGVPGVILPEVPTYVRHAWYKFYFFVDREKLAPGWDRDRILQEINELGVPCYTGTCCEIYKEKAFSRFPEYNVQSLPNAGYLDGVSLMVLVHPTLDSGIISVQADEVVRVFEKAVSNGY